mgnify:FL=1|jgi:uncharacterized membrane protein (DUF485 family)
MQTRNARMGIILFAVYLVLYGGFVLINTFSPESMEATPIAGINVAILYGFGLIIAAFIMALLYGFLCDSDDGEASSTEDDQ